MFARTPRLLLRPGWAEDAPALHRAIADEQIVRNLANVPWPYRHEDARAFLSRPYRPCAPTSLIFLRTGAAPRLVGCVGLEPAEGGAAEFGYWIARPFWGRGIATEAGRAMIAAARGSMRLERLVAGHFVDNPASGRVLAKLGFRPTGHTRLRFSAGRGREVPSLEVEMDLEPQMPAPGACLIAA
jgi:RimJ/RimL family protein N-acetyltransferase